MDSAWRKDLNNVTLSSSLDQRRPDRPDAVHAQFTPSRIDRKTGRRTRTMHPMEISSPRHAVVVVEFGIAGARFKRKKLKLKL